MVKTKWLTIAEVCEYVGPRGRGEGTAEGTVRQWIDRGLSGTRLMAQYRGGVIMTTVEWIEEFFERVSQIRSRKKRNRIIPTPTQRRRSHQKAVEKLKAANAI